MLFSIKGGMVSHGVVMPAEEFRKAPFLRLIFPLAGGIILRGLLCGPAVFDWFFMGFSLSFILFSMLHPRLGQIPLLFSFLLLGIMLGRKESLVEIPEGRICARICDEVVPSGKWMVSCIDQISYLEKANWKSIKGKASVYFKAGQGNPGSTRLSALKPGDVLLIQGKLLPYASPMNPNQFDYAAFQRGKGILYRIYLDQGSWAVSGEQSQDGLRIRAILLRRNLIRKIESRIQGEEQRAVLSSLLLGYRKEMDRELKQSFVRSGTLHLLAVSGLHVGIIYMLPALLLRRLKHKPGAGMFTAALVFSGLWMYAFITGLTPSVVRAVLMCCIHGIAMMSRRKVSTLHVISLAAFIMIIARPAAVFEAGFQLSFAAVTGIILLYRRILFYLPQPGMGLPAPVRIFSLRITQMVAVSIAAQISTLPLSIFYFNQFAPVSVLANLVAIPLVTLILYMGIAFLSMAGISQVAEILASLLNWMSSFLKWFTGSLSGIPWIYIDGLFLLPSQVLLLYISGLLILMYFRRRTVRRLYTVLVSLILLSGISIYHEYSINKHNQVYIFNIPGETIIAFVDGRESVLYGESEPSADPVQTKDINDLPYEIKPFFRRNKIEAPTLVKPGEKAASFIPWHRTVYSPEMKGDYFIYKRKRLFVLREWERQFCSKLPVFELDVIVLSNNPRISIDEITSHFNVSQIVTDGSCYLQYSREMEEECRRVGIRYHSTRKSGCLSY